MNQNEVQTGPRPPKSKRPISKKAAIILLVVLPLLGVAFGVWHTLDYLSDHASEGEDVKP